MKPLRKPLLESIESKRYPSPLTLKTQSLVVCLNLVEAFTVEVLCTVQTLGSEKAVSCGYPMAYCCSYQGMISFK